MRSQAVSCEEIIKKAIQVAQRATVFANLSEYENSNAELENWPYGTLHTGDSRSIIAQHDLNAKDRVWIMAYSLASHLRMKQLRDEVFPHASDVRIILPDPFSRERVTARHFVDPLQVCSWYTFLKGLRPGCGRVGPGTLPCAISRFDDVLLVRPYLPNRSGHHSPVVVLQPSNRGYDQFVALFEEIWDASDATSFAELSASEKYSLQDLVYGKILLDREVPSERRPEELQPSRIANAVGALHNREGIAKVSKRLRPALFTKGAFFLIDDDHLRDEGEPVHTLCKHRELIQRWFLSVARVEGATRGSFFGTAWHIAPGILVTNRHVAQEFVTRIGDRFRLKGPVYANFKAEFNGKYDANERFMVEDVLHVEDELDVALLHIASTSGDGSPLPPTIPLASDPARMSWSSQVAVVGYPDEDTREPCQAEVFMPPFGVKRVSPGSITEITEKTYKHDCATLGGSSGSVMLHLETGEAVGLHYSSFRTTVEGQHVCHGNGAIPIHHVQRILDEARQRYEVRQATEAPAHADAGTAREPLGPEHLIWPVFITEVAVDPRPIPGAAYVQVHEIPNFAHRADRLGLYALLLFGAPAPASKDDGASAASRPDGLVQQALAAFKKTAPSLRIITDVCLCAYRPSGECILRDPSTGEHAVKETAERLGTIAESYLAAGAYGLATSCYGRQVVRLCELVPHTTPLFAYFKMASSLYGGYRQSIASPLPPHHRKSYQFDPADKASVVASVADHLRSSHDIVPVIKPGLPCLDILAAVRRLLGTSRPLAVFSVSGEQTMLEAAGELEGAAFDKQATALEVVGAFRRAGADLIITYAAEALCHQLASATS